MKTVPMTKFGFTSLGIKPAEKLTAVNLPKGRAMDTYSAEVAAGFTAKEAEFFGPQPYAKDNIIDMRSPYGFFRIDTYTYHGNPNEIQCVVFFCNKVTKLTYEIHGTIARDYIERVRNRSNIEDFPISDTRAFADPQGQISCLSKYSLRWEQATNAVHIKYYKPYAPGQANNPAKVHEYDPLKKETLVACSEEYSIVSPALNFSNWKDENDLGKYDGSIGFRHVGMPTQILLHETAAFGNMAIPNVREEGTGKGAYYPIPHFCVNNLDDQGKGNIIQFVDVATKVSHGEVTNDRAIGIEFVNAPIEAYLTGPDGKVLLPRQPVFKLDTISTGIYLNTKLPAFKNLFIPLEFSEEADDTFYELKLKESSLVNYNALKAGAGKDKKQVLTGSGDDVRIRFAKSDKFEHLATLVSSLSTNKLVVGLDDLSDEKFWKPVVSVGDKKFYIFENGWEAVGKTFYFYADLREQGVFTHVFIGHHADGGLQGLYLYLKFVKKIPAQAILQLMIDLLTSDKTADETKGIKLDCKVFYNTAHNFVDPPAPRTKRFTSILELS